MRYNIKTVIALAQTRDLNDDFRGSLHKQPSDSVTVSNRLLAVIGDLNIYRNYHVLASIKRDVANFTFPPTIHHDDDHSCASFISHDIACAFRIECFSPDRRRKSSNPADPKITKRILTIMLAEEF